MKKGGKIIAIIVFIVVILFGVGQFFTAIVPSVPNNQSSTSTTTASAAPVTEVISYVPPQPASSTPVEQGSCWTNSIAAYARGDAWRCAVGNGISDPCFEIPDSTSTLLCDVNPEKPDSTSTFVLALTKPLPASQPVENLPPQEQVWLLELQDGTLCSPFTGTRPFDANGDSANFGCAPGPDGSNAMIFGDLNTSSSLWTAQIGVLSTPTSTLPVMLSSSTIPVLKVWE